ncbi:MAG TPA: hypothetical protein VIM22_02665, partial [Solirubrobacteraceae bacterium]
ASADARQLEARTTALLRKPPPVADAGHCAAELRVVTGWLASHPETPTLALRPPPAAGRLLGLATRATA